MQVRLFNFITSKKIRPNYDSEENNVAKSLHARGLEPRIFRAADAHATNKQKMRI